MLNWHDVWRPLEDRERRLSHRLKGQPNNQPAPGEGSSRDVAIDNLNPSQFSGIREEVERLSFDTGRLHSLPLEVILLQFRIGGLLRLLCDRLDGGGSVDRLLGAGNVGQAWERPSAGEGTSEVAEYSRLFEPVHGCWRECKVG